MSYPVPSPGEVWAFRPILPRRLLVEIDEFDTAADLVRFHYCTTGRDIELPLTRFVQHYVPSVDDPNTSTGPEVADGAPLTVGDLTPSHQEF